MPAGNSIIGDCAECCTCPQPVVKYDQCTLNVAPGGTASDNIPSLPEGIIFRQYERDTLASDDGVLFNEGTTLTQYASGAAGLAVTGCLVQSPSATLSKSTIIRRTNSSCVGSIYESASDFQTVSESLGIELEKVCGSSCNDVCGGGDGYWVSWVGSATSSYDSVLIEASYSHNAGFGGVANGSGRFEFLSQAWTLSAFTSAIADLDLVFTGTFAATSGGAVYSQAGDGIDTPLSAIISSLRYRFENAGASTIRPGNGSYRINWLERFIPATGVSITSVELKASGCYRPSVGLSTSPVPGNNAVAVAHMASDGSVDSIRVLAPGNYRPAITFSAAPVGGRRATGIVTALNPATGGVAAWEITDPGAGYLTAPTVTFSTPATGAGNRAIGTATIVGGMVTAITLSAAGNYRPTVSLSPAGTTSAASAVIDASGLVTAITGGTGGAFMPTFSIIGGGSGSGAIITATMDVTGGLASITLASGGSNYTKNPRVAVNPPPGSSPTAEAVVHLRCGTETARDLTVAAGGNVTILPDVSPGYYEIAPPSMPGTTSVANVWATCS